MTATPRGEFSTPQFPKGPARTPRRLVRVRRALVLGTVFGAAGVALVGPAAAQTPDTWTEPPPTSWLETLAIFGGIPAGLFLLITLLTLAPSLIRHGGYQPGMSWWAGPQRFGAQPESGSAAQTSTPAHQERAGLAHKVGGVGARW